MQKWSELPPLKQARLAADDTRLTEGKLPIDFLLKFARRYLNNKMVSIVETSARVWVRRKNEDGNVIIAPQAHSNFLPQFEEVMSQLISNNPLNRESAHVLDYLTHKAINKWNDLDAHSKQSFITESDNPSYGGLPKNYIRYQRKHTRRNLKAARRRAAVFGQILKRVPHLAEQPFTQVNLRAEQLILGWNGLSNEIKEGFMSMEKSTTAPKNPWALPIPYIEHMKPSLAMGLEQKTGTTNIDKVYRGYKLDNIMQSLSQQNAKLSAHPNILINGSIGIVKAWIQLPDQMKELFFKEDSANITAADHGKTISNGFIDLHAQIATIINVDAKGTPYSGSSGGNGQAGGTGQTSPQGASGSNPIGSGSSIPTQHFHGADQFMKKVAPTMPAEYQTSFSPHGGWTCSMMTP